MRSKLTLRYKIAMDIPYHIQKRSILILYASGTLLETFRQALFYEDIILPFGKEEGCFQCYVDSNAQPDSWQIELQIIGSTKYEAYQIEDDGTLLDNNGDVVPDLIKHLVQEYDASNIRTAIVHVQGKGQQKIVAFLANSNIQQQIPCAIKDHQGTDRILQYKQPDVLADPQMSNVHVKEIRTDHHIISQAKAINQRARISAFFPFPHNELSRRRFNRVKSINVCVNRSDILCTVLDETVPVCLVNQELATQEAASLLDFLIHKQPILNHHSAFLSCLVNCPEQSSQNDAAQESLLTLPYFSSIVHCHLSCNQFLTVYQPRFEDGKVSRCIGNSLQLAVYEHTDIVLFLTGQFEIFDLFETAPKGCITAVWKVTEASTSLVCPFDKVSCQDPAIARRDQVIEANATPHAKARRSSLLQDTKQKSTIDSKRLQQVETNLEQATPPAAVREAGAALYEVSPLDPPTDHDANPQCAATAKRGLSSLEALVRKVPVPKLPGADNRYKTLAGRLEDNLVPSSQPIEQLEVPCKEQGKGQASDAAIERSDSGLPSRGVNHPLSNTPHDALLLTKDRVVDYVDDCVAPTQIDIESTGDSCHMNQEETSISLRNLQGDACHADNHSPKENKTKEAETGLCHLKEKENVRCHCQTLQPILPGTTGTVHPIQDQPFKEARQLSQHPPIEPDLSCFAVSTVGNNMHDTHAATKVTQEIDCSLDDSIIKEIDMQDAKEPTEGAKEDGAKYHVDEQIAPKIDTTSHDKGIWPAQNVEPEQEIRKSKSVINLLEDTIVPTFGNLSFSLTERRILAHLHTLKQLVASKVSLVNMEFGEEDLTQAAKLYDNLNATACFYTTALRLLSKADWQEPVDFEDHIVHQAMIAVARGWTTAVGVKTLPFDKHYLALSMATLPSAAHGEVKRTFDSIVATLPSPFKEKASSKVVFTCRVCGKKASHDVPTFIVLEPIISQASGHEFFNAAVPWTENLLPGSAESLHDSVPNCYECASDSSWIIEAESKCKLVWFQFPREFHPQALQYATFIGKDPFFVRGLSWKCVSVVIHQGIHFMVKTNLRSIFMSLRTKDPSATPFATTMLLASTILMIRKSDLEIGSVHYCFVPLTLPPSGLYNAHCRSSVYRKIVFRNKTKAKEVRTDEFLGSYLAPKKGQHSANNLHNRLKFLLRKLPKTPTLTKIMALLKMRYVLFLSRRLIILKIFSPNRKPDYRAH